MPEFHPQTRSSSVPVLKYATIVLNMRTNRCRPPTQLVEILFGAYRRQILALMLLRPEESFYVREVARVTGVPAGSLHRELTSLNEAGLLVRSTSGNQVRYQADRSCPIYEELAGIFRKTAGLADVLRDLLKPLKKKIDLGFVFGSVAQGKARPGSDIDLLVVGSVPFASVVEACHAGTQRLGREVNPVVMTKTALLAKHRQSDRFISRVAKEPKIFVIGDASEFAKFTEDRPD
jgi:predicted nucleotidyltransferase